MLLTKFGHFTFYFVLPGERYRVIPFSMRIMFSRSVEQISLYLKYDGEIVKRSLKGNAWFCLGGRNSNTSGRQFFAALSRLKVVIELVSRAEIRSKNIHGIILTILKKG